MVYYDNNYFEKLKQIVIQYVFNNYDYVYLDSMHEKTRKAGKEIKTIITGSSHAMNGIVEEILDDVINFSISSQDIYYDFQHIKKVLENEKKNVQNCVINIGYYMLYQDLSLSKNLNWMIYKIYGPLFGDTHHYNNIGFYDMWNNIDYDRNVFGDKLVKELCCEWGRGVFMEQSSYYGFLKTREQNNALTISGVDWRMIDDEKREVLAIERTNDHNRLIQHNASRKENGELIREMAKYLYDRKIRIIFWILPFTKYYNKYINKSYKEDIYQLLDGLETPVELLDMNDFEGIFDNSDFIDTDHLTLDGAKKASRLLANYLEN